MQFLERISVVWRVALFGAIAVTALFAVELVGAFALKKTLVDAKHTQTQRVTEVAFSVIAHHAALEAAGLPRAEAQQRALAALRGLRYDGSEYFWVNDMQSRMVLHPVKPELEGKVLDQMKDPTGKRLIAEFVAQVQNHGAGFVEYLWPRPGREDPIPKISYVKGFAPWGWVVGTGVYADDIEKAFWAQATRSIVLGCVALAMLGLGGWLILRSILRQLGGEPAYAVALASRIAGGDLSSEIRIGAGDRTSILAALREMQKNLRSILGKIVADAGKVSAGVEHLAAEAGEITEATKKQTGATLDTGSAVEEISRSAAVVARLAQETEDHSNEVANLTMRGEAIVQGAAEGMNTIAQTVQHASQQIGALETRANEIGTIARVIKEIADQTNLLALNAAIEAARAGEQGRGFAVVADEVRKLAERTAQATTQIARTIDAIQSDTRLAVDGMATTAPIIGEGVEKAAQAAEVLRSIREESQSALEKITNLAQSAETQTAKVSHIVANVHAVMEMAQKTEAVVQRSTQTAVELDRAAQSLYGVVRQFRVTDSQISG
jgi:methyl-accepting chemotaxis protein